MSDSKQTITYDKGDIAEVTIDEVSNLYVIAETADKNNVPIMILKAINTTVPRQKIKIVFFKKATQK